MSNRLIAIDVDGTLQNSSHEMSDGNANALREAVTSGIEVVLCTGKQHSTIVHHINRVGLTSPQITAGGAIITDPQTNTEIYRKDIPPDIAVRILEHADRLGITTISFRDGQTFTRIRNTDIEHMLTYGDPFPTFMDDVSQSFDPPPVQIMCIAYGNDALYEQAYAEFTEAFSEIVGVRKSSPYYIEFTGLNVSKGTALTWLARRLNVQLDNVTAIGDSFNDLSMFEVAGTSVAVANAPASVREAADVIVPSNDDDGVAHIIHELLRGAI